MASSYTTFENLPHDMNDTASIRALIKQFRDKLAEAGLNFIANESEDVDTKPVPDIPSFNNNGGYGYWPFVKLVYRLPTGNGKVQYEDVPGKDYKKIVKASYPAYPLKIRFTFGYYKITQGSFSAQNGNYNNCMALACSVAITSSESFVGAQEYYMSSYVRYNGIGVPSRVQDTTKNIIINNENQLIIQFNIARFKIDDAALGYYPIVGLILTRDKDSYNIFVSKDEQNASNSPVDMWIDNEYNYSKKSQTPQTSSTPYMDQVFSIPFTSSPITDLNGGIIVYPFLRTAGPKLTEHKSIFASKATPAAITDNEFIVNDNGINVIHNYINMGSTVSTRPLINTSYAFMFRATQYECTGDPL